MIDPDRGFTSGIIKNPDRFVGRTELIRSCIRSINSQHGLIAVYGKRGVGKSSLLRQVQQIAVGDYKLVKNSGLANEIPKHPRKYFTVYYQCDNLIGNCDELVQRLINDQDAEDGLLRLVPNDGKELVEFSRSKEIEGGQDLKVIKWGAKGIETSKYVKTVPGDSVQTFRNFIQSVITHQVEKRGRDGLLILLDEFDIIKDKSGIGSLIKSISSDKIKFGICGIGRDLTDLVTDHGSVERLLEQGAVHVETMSDGEVWEIFNRATRLFGGEVTFADDFVRPVVEVALGYPYFVQMIGRASVEKANQRNVTHLDAELYQAVLEDIKSGRAFPTLESAYQRGIGGSEDRKVLLHLLAEQPEDAAVASTEAGKVFLKGVRAEAEDLDLKYIDQNLPRLVDPKFGPILDKVPGKQGVYEFLNPILRLYIRLRNF